MAMEAPIIEGKHREKYRQYIHGDAEKNTRWRYGAPPDYTVVDQFFEQGRTKVFVRLRWSSPEILNLVLTIYIYIYQIEIFIILYYGDNVS